MKNRFEKATVEIAGRSDIYGICVYSLVMAHFKRRHSKTMKLLTIFQIFGLTILIGCGQTTKKQSGNQTDTLADTDNKEEILFDDYLTAIPETKLPLGLKCEIDLNGSTLEFDRNTIDKYGQENSRINGKIAVTEKFAAIIYLYPADIILPIIQTTDRQGNKISELKIYERWCGEDEFSWGNSWATISKDLTITLSDSAIIYKRNNEGQIIEESKTTEVRHRKFQIDNNGRINEKKNEP